MRYEFKYLLNEVQYQIMESWLEMVAVLDNYNRNREYNPVLSYYFDTPELKFYHQKVEGEDKQLKVRVRTYESISNANTPHYFEIKQKKGILRDKCRYKIEKNRDHDFLNWVSLSKKLPLAPFSFGNLVPVCKILYERKAYSLLGAQSATRITMDRNIQVAEPLDSQHLYLTRPKGCYVMEVKTPNKIYPDILREHLNSLFLEKVSNSKYVNGINCLKRQYKGL